MHKTKKQKIVLTYKICSVTEQIFLFRMFVKFVPQVCVTKYTSLITKYK
jgi:hypothetical protein